MNAAADGTIGVPVMRRSRLIVDYPHSRAILEPQKTFSLPDSIDASGLTLRREIGADAPIEHRWRECREPEPTARAGSVARRRENETARASPRYRHAECKPASLRCVLQSRQRWYMVVPVSRRSMHPPP